MTIKTKTEAVKYHYSEAKDSAKRHVFTPKFIASQEDRRGKLTVAVFKDLNGVKRGSKYLSENAKKSNLYNRLGAVHGLPDSLDSILTEANMKDGAATNAVLLEDITRSLEKNGADLAAEIHKDPRAAMSMMVGTYKRILDDLDKSYGELKPFFSAVRTANSLISKQAAIRFHRGPKSLFVEADERKLVQLATYINNHQDQFKEQLKTLKAAQVHLDMITEIRNAMKEGNYTEAKDIAQKYHTTYNDAETADTLEMSGREATATAGIKNLREEIEKDVRALIAYKTSKEKIQPDVTNADVNVKMRRLFLYGHALLHTLDEELKSATTPEMKEYLEDLKINTEIELTNANQTIKGAWDALGKGKSMDMSKVKTDDKDLVGMISGFLKAEKSREAGLKDDIEDKMRTLSRIMGIPAIKLDDAVEKALKDLVTMKALLHDKNIFNESEYMDTLAEPLTATTPIPTEINKIHGLE